MTTNHNHSIYAGLLSGPALGLACVLAILAPIALWAIERHAAVHAALRVLLGGGQ